MLENGNILQAIDATIRILNSISIPIELLESVGIPIMAARKNLENIMKSICDTEAKNEKIVAMNTEETDQQIRG